MANNPIFTLFRNEKERLSDLGITVFYDKEDIIYQKDTERLFASFDTKHKEESFYYQAEKNFPILIAYTITGNGKNGTIEDRFYSMPKEFQQICQDYQYNRADIGILRYYKQMKANKEMER